MLILKHLSRSYQKTRQVPTDGDRISVAFSWTSSLSDPFTRLLYEHDPIAVLVLAHFAALLSECQHSWWMRELPQRVVAAAQKLLMSTPELLDYLDWPLQIINAHTGP
ncbi:hypothetical protein DM02DRAFT_81899 [Periconia macrospinosa]|uniref:Uncharacterized protein n=1 Tax=Periconia macrospinosa TaxID=97972 RepID=A0A2V1DH58_9PLEO|nr:hypothetical protein DM02DRAFT_81899 [Periconia macrospinosa]